MTKCTERRSIVPLIPEPTRHPSSTHFTLMSSPKVISVGANPELLWLRHAVLECAGFNVLTAIGENDALTKIRKGRCGILLMCYSLTKEARKALSQQYRERCPRGRIIAITNQQLEHPDYADSFVYGVEGPEILIQTLRKAEQ